MEASKIGSNICHLKLVSSVAIPITEPEFLRNCESNSYPSNGVIFLTSDKRIIWLSNEYMSVAPITLSRSMLPSGHPQSLQILVNVAHDNYACKSSLCVPKQCFVTVLASELVTS